MNNDHYPAELLEEYNLLLDYFPSDKVCRPYAVDAIKKWQQSKGIACPDVLEIGPGNGETTKLILNATPAK